MMYEKRSNRLSRPAGSHRTLRGRGAPPTGVACPADAGSLLLALTAFLLTSCTWIYGPEMAVPENLSATTAETDKIVLTWDAVENADIYYIYRSPSQDGTFGYHSFSYTAGYTDTDIDPEVAYYYKVTASDLESNNESPLTAAVRGDSRHDFAWSQTAVLSTAGASQIRICADPAPAAGSHDDYRAWAVLAGDTPGSPAEVHGYNRKTDGWEQFGEPFGSIDPSSPGSIDVAAYAGEVFAAYADTGYGGRITVKRYDWAAETWNNVGTTGPEGITGSDDARYISLEVAPAAAEPLPELVWIESDGSTYAVSSSFYDHSSDAWSTPVPLPDGGSGADPYVGTSTIRTASRLIAAFEDESGSGDRIKSGKFDGTTWTAVSSTGGLPGGGEDILDGYATLSGFSATDLYLAFMTDVPAFEVRRYDGTDWTTDLTPGGVSVSTVAETVGLAADDVDGEKYLYLFYRDGLSGYVRRRDISAGTWELLPLSADTEEMSLNPTYPEATAYNNLVFCAFLTGTSAQVRVWR